MTPPIIITPRNIFIAGFIIYMLSIKYRQLSQEGHTFNPPGAARTSRTLRKASSSGNGNNNKRSKEIGDDGALSCALSEPFEEFFMNAQHMLIHFRRWLPIHPSYLPNASSFSSQERIRLSKTVQKPRGIVLIVHGMGEHCARYDSFAKAMNQEGLIVYVHVFNKTQMCHYRPSNCKNNGYITQYNRDNGSKPTQTSSNNNHNIQCIDQC